MVSGVVSYLYTFETPQVCERHKAYSKHDRSANIASRFLSVRSFPNDQHSRESQY